MKKLFTKISVIGATIVSALSAMTVKAAGLLDSNAPDNRLATTNINNPGSLVTSIISIVLAVAGAVAVLFLIIGGFRYVTAQGNEDSVDAAKTTIKNAIIGLVIILLAFAILQAVQNFVIGGAGIAQ